MKTLLKSVHIYQSYCKKNLAQFFWPTLYVSWQPLEPYCTQNHWSKVTWFFVFYVCMILPTEATTATRELCIKSYSANQKWVKLFETGCIYVRHAAVLMSVVCCYAVDGIHRVPRSVRRSHRERILSQSVSKRTPRPLLWNRYLALRRRNCFRRTAAGWLIILWLDYLCTVETHAADINVRPPLFCQLL